MPAFMGESEIAKLQIFAADLMKISFFFDAMLLVSSVAGHCWYNGEREIADVSCGHFGSVRLKLKLSAYVPETVGDRQEGLHTESVKQEKLLAADTGIV